MILYEDHMMASAKVLIYDPCPMGLPEILTAAHVGIVVKRCRE